MIYVDMPYLIVSYSHKVRQKCLMLGFGNKLTDENKSFHIHVEM